MVEDLLDKNRFYSVSELENTNTVDISGVYAIRLKSNSTLPEPFETTLKARNTNLIYIGKGERNLRKRLYQEFRGRGHGTFFRGIGAILKYLPPKGSLVNKKNKNNYKFSKEDKEKIVAWINKNIEFSFVEIYESIKEKEKGFIEVYMPIFNTAHNPQPSEELADLREVCRNHALRNIE